MTQDALKWPKNGILIDNNPSRKICILFLDRYFVDVLDIRALVSCLALFACESPPTELPGPSFTEFRDQAYPLLLRDCGFVQCHGDNARFFVLYGPGRARLDAETDVFDPPTEDELWFAYQSSRAMLTSNGDMLDSPLLSKPLEGRAHGGLDLFGRNVWHADDPAWQTLADWATREP